MFAHFPFNDLCDDKKLRCRYTVNVSKSTHTLRSRYGLLRYAKVVMDNKSNLFLLLRSIIPECIQPKERPFFVHLSLRKS